CGEVVTPGQNIAVTGNSGRSSGPHLHFEVRGSNGAPVNPWEWLSF
ncbi:MAG: M23 family metallopeptidase, partial [Chloroflexi bacterium]|nr:M23 family metallopeptidase [Chloroflexota bacterium]